MPDYVVNAPGRTFDVPRGTNAATDSLLATSGAQLTDATLDDQTVTIFPGMERGHPIFQAQVTIPPGLSVELRYELSEPTSPGAPRLPIQPLLDNVAPLVSVPECQG